MGCHQVSDIGIRHLAQAVTALVLLDISSCRYLLAVKDHGFSIANLELQGSSVAHMCIGSLACGHPVSFATWKDADSLLFQATAIW